MAQRLKPSESEGGHLSGPGRAAFQPEPEKRRERVRRGGKEDGGGRVSWSLALGGCVAS